jgi:hypothetical protein
MSNKPSNKDRASKKALIANPFRATAWYQAKPIKKEVIEDDCFTEIFLLSYLLEQTVEYIADLEIQRRWAVSQ